jgi:hypothetical protein
LRLFQNFSFWTKSFKALFFPERETVFSGGKKYFHGRQVTAFDAENRTGPWEGRLPGDSEKLASEAVRRPWGKDGVFAGIIVHFIVL